MMLTIFDCQSEHFEKSEKPQTQHNWFLINCGEPIPLHTLPGAPQQIIAYSLYVFNSLIIFFVSNSKYH